MPDEYAVPDSEEFDWMKDMPPGLSVTELEIMSAALLDPEKVLEKAFFYLRNNTFEK